MAQKKFYTLTEIQEQLADNDINLSRQTIWRMQKRGELKSRQIGKQFFVPGAELDRLLNGSQQMAAPRNCKRTALSTNALDSHTRRLAEQTQITIGNKKLLCSSFRVTDKGTLQLEILDGCFELRERAESVKV